MSRKPEQGYILKMPQPQFNNTYSIQHILKLPSNLTEEPAVILSNMVNLGPHPLKRRTYQQLPLLF